MVLAFQQPQSQVCQCAKQAHEPVTVTPVTPLPPRSSKLIEGAMDGLSTGFADMQLIINSDLPADDKVKLISELMSRREALTDKLIERKKNQRRDIMDLIHSLGIFVLGLFGAGVF